MLESTRLRGLLALLCIIGLHAAPGLAAQATPDTDRLDVPFLGDDGHHQPTERARQILPVMAANGIDVRYTDRTSDLNPATPDDYHALIHPGGGPRP